MKVTWRLFSQLNVWFLFWYVISNKHLYKSNYSSRKYTTHIKPRIQVHKCTTCFVCCIPWSTSRNGDNGPLKNEFYDKRDALNVTIANYLHVRSNIPTSSVYKVYISVDTIFKSFWFLNRLVDSNKKATESMVPRWMFCGRHSFIIFLQYIL